MKNKKIVILEGNMELRGNLQRAFEERGYTVCGVTDDGAEGVELIKRHAPDVTVCEVFLKSLDGMGVMDEVKSAGINTDFIVISAAADDNLLEHIMERGAKYCLLKPFSVETAVNRVDELLQRGKKSEIEKSNGVVRRNASLDEKISNIFISIGIPPHIKGYNYLREGIKMAVEDPNIINNITKI